MVFFELEGLFKFGKIKVSDWAKFKGMYVEESQYLDLFYCLLHKQWIVIEHVTLMQIKILSMCYITHFQVMAFVIS